MSCTYFWKNEEVLEIRHRIHYEEGVTWYCDLFCVDAFRPEIHDRYGMFFVNEGWRYIPFESFPKEFRMHLLLLDIS